MAKTVRFIHHSHFDPIWRRAWQRPIHEQGLVYQPYAVVEAAVIRRWIELAEREGVTFGEGQAAVWRSFFQRHPERLDQVRALYERGLLDLFTCGEVIADSNMPSGEAYVRNVLYGILALRELFGEAGHSPIGWLCDAFGNCAQLPQVFRSLGVECLFRLSYSEPDGEVWRGLDGTTIPCREPWPIQILGGWIKSPPCAACRGTSCEACDGTGIDPSNYRGSPEEVVQAASRLEGPVGAVLFQTEESPPQEGHLEGVKRLREQGVDAGFGTYRELLERCPLPQDGKVGTKCDLNPACTGCYVTRIRTKQRVRECEYTLMGLESLAVARGAVYDPAPVRDAWRTLSFTLFHDAITGTHVDGAYDELMALFDEVEAFAEGWRRHLIGAPAFTADGVEAGVIDPLAFERGADVVRAPEGLPRGTYTVTCDGKTVAESVELASGEPIGLPAMRGAVLRIQPTERVAPEAPTRFENRFLSVDFDDRWLVAVHDRCTGERLDADHRRWRPLDLTAEPDYGDPWSSFLDSTQGVFTWALSPYVTHHALTAVAGGKRLSYWGAYRGDNKYIGRLAFRADFTLWDEAPCLDLELGIDWDTRSTRLRLALPFAGDGNRGRYEVPFGNLERERYQGSFRMCGTNGDWPAQTWVDVALANGRRLALFNSGTPSHRVQDGVLSCSFLRSPDASTLLNETEYYEYHAHDGMRDAGKHAFRFRLLAHGDDIGPDDLTRAGIAFNTPLLLGRPDASAVKQPFELDVPGVVPIAAKRSEDGAAWIVRLVELGGKETRGTFAWSAGKAAIRASNLLEEPGDVLAAAGQPAELSFRAFEIKTLRIEPAN